MLSRGRILPALLFAPFALPAQTRPNQLGFNIGAEFIPGNSLAADPLSPRPVTYTDSLSLELFYGRDLRRLGPARLSFDLPALVGPNHKIRNGDGSLPTSLATFYVTPGLRLSLPNHTSLTPWISTGAGYSLLETSDYLAGGASNASIHTHTTAFQFGAGADLHTPLHILAFPISARGEFRDFFTLAQPTFFTPVTGSSQHNLTVSGGLFLSF